MWKPKPESASTAVFTPAPDPVRGVQSGKMAEITPTRTGGPDQARLGKGIVLRGEITGSDSLYIDGTLEGTIHVSGARVTVGPNGRVIATGVASSEPCITAHEIIVMGSVKGNVFATDRVDVRAQASLTGDVATGRVSIEEGAYFRGGIDIRREGQRAEAAATLETVDAI